MTAAVLVAVIAALPAVLAQPGQLGPEPCSTEPACVEAMSCAKRREPFYWRNVFDINRCHLSMEVRVGLTVSMTGPLSRNATTEQILQTLRNLSSAKGQVDFVSIGVSFPYCLIFCVMDDESLPWKAVEHYRVFAGDSGYDSPSSSDFRLAAAQVADEFQRPLVSWSLPEIMGISFVRPAQSTVASTGAWLGNLLGSNSVIETDNVFGRLPEELLFTCRDLVVPSNYSLRTMAQFLPCDGPCDLSRDLDYCAVPRQELSITGHWDPPSVLRSGGWDNGCLSFDSNGTAARLEIVMILDTPRATVNVGFWGGNSKTGPLLVLGSRLYSSSPPGPLVLPSGTQVMLDSSSDERIEFSICLKQDCQYFTCPAGYKRTAFGSLCNGVQCAPEDLQNCCALDQLPHVNGPFWSNSFTSVLEPVCSMGPRGMSKGWDEAKSRSSWIIVPCLPPEACLGSNRCAAFHTGATCSGCAPGSSKFQWYFFGLDCEECPPMVLQILQISLMGIIQVVATILLSVSNKDSAWNEHSLAGPIMFSFFRTLQTHAVLSKLMIEPFPQHAFHELGPLLWICTISQVVFAPCLLPLTSCLIPLHTEGDLMAYHLLELASRLGILLLSCTLMACLARGGRLDAFVRTGYTGLHFVLPSLSFYALALSQCELGYAATSATFVLAANRDMPCPAMTSNLAYLFAAVHIVAMISQWLCLPWILTKFIYRHVQDCYGMGIHKVMHGKRYWKILDDMCIAVSTLFATALGEAGMTYCMFATEGSYAILTRVTQAYSFLSGNLMVHFKSQMALNILCLCSGNLFTDFLIDFFSEFLAQDLDHASMICRATILSLSLAHMLLVTSMALLENRVALVVNTRLLSAPADGWTVRLSRMVQGFGSFHSMEVHRCGSNSQLVFDARSVPQKHRKILLHGVTSTVHYILYRSTTLRLTEVRDMVNQAVEQILVARKSQVMSRLNTKGCRRSLTQEDDQAIEALLQSDLIAPHELVSTVEDMCSGDFIYRQGTKKSSTVAESEDEEPKTPNENIPHKAKKALAAATKKNSKPKHIRRRFHEAQAECARSTAKLLTEADSLNRRLGRIWMISTENSKLIPAYLDKAETLHGLLQRIHDFLGEERDARHPAVENFLDEVISQTRDWNSQVENLTRQRGAKDKDPRGVAASEAELDQELRNLFQEEAESSVTMAPDDDKSSSTAHISLRPGPERPRVKLPFNRIDFQSRTQPAPSRYPDLDWHR